MDDIREQLESAYEEGEQELEEQDETEVETEEEEESTEDEGSSEDESSDEGSEEEPPSDVVEDTGTKIGDGEGKEEPPGVNAPLGFSPEAREKWKNVPNIVKEQIHKREQEIENAMRGTAEARRSHSAITELARSYAPVLAAEGADTPMQAIEGLFKTVAELRVGSPQQAATKMAGLIKHYGVDIQMLDTALSGQQPANPEVTQMQQMLDQRLAPFQDMLQGQKNQQQHQQQESQNAVNNELKEFSTQAEFLNDVRNDMADLIDLASKQGRKMGFKEAYDKSCAMNPSISKVLADREAASTLQNSGQKVSGKLNASSSLKSKSGNLSGNKKDQSLRGEIESLWGAYE